VPGCNFSRKPGFCPQVGPITAPEERKMVTFLLFVSVVATTSLLLAVVADEGLNSAFRA